MEAGLNIGEEIKFLFTEATAGMLGDSELQSIVFCRYRKLASDKIIDFLWPRVRISSTVTVPQIHRIKHR